ncbi:MAG: CHASE2 domain-containing protein, partial [Bdellovibrionales bacterium]|nr:CHASE2 domain-containing protein [Bdellovibrionales bacterium]
MLRWLNILIFAGLLTLLHWGIYSGRIGERIEYFLSDQWFSLRGPVDPPEDILLVTLDEDSYQELEVPLSQAWPRALHAKLLESLKAAGARKVVFDIFFEDESGDPQADKDLQEALTLLPTVITANETNFLAQKGGTTLLMPKLFEPFAGQVALGSFPEDYGTVRRFKTKRTAHGALQMPTIAEAA